MENSIPKNILLQAKFTTLFITMLYKYNVITAENILKYISMLNIRITQEFLWFRCPKEETLQIFIG